MNTEYYIISEGERRGPYTAEAMRGIGLRPDTMVWRQGMADWAPASELAELADIDRSHISAIELGNVGVSFDVIFKLCEVLEITPKQLFDFRE